MTTPPEQPASFPDHFSGHAALYARSRPTYPESLIAEIASLSPGSSCAWDAGTGNGQAAGLLARHFERVHATDASEAQIAEAQPYLNVEYVVEPAERCSLPDGGCDLVLSAQAMHWFDLRRFYPEVRRVLRPGGILAAIGYGWFYVDPVVDEIVARTLLKPLMTKWKPGNWMLIDGYRTIDFPGEEVRMTPSAIHLAWNREQFTGYVRSWSVVQDWDPRALEASFGELAGAWPDDQERQVTMPMAIRVARL